MVDMPKRTDAADQASVPESGRFKLGRHGEMLALESLERAGYRVVAANFSLPIGRNTRDVVVNGEIDIVAYDGPTLCFIEVKTRASDEVATPLTNIDLRKRRQIARAGRAYRRLFGLARAPFRYDVVAVVTKPEADDPRIEIRKGFWTDAQLRKARRQDSHWH